jgi:hypothetical protein
MQYGQELTAIAFADTQVTAQRSGPRSGASRAGLGSQSYPIMIRKPAGDATQLH